MSDDWYYIKDGKPRGPLSTNELSAILSMQPSGGDIPVWRSGFSNWEKARHVPDFAPQTGRTPNASNSGWLDQQLRNMYVGCFSIAGIVAVSLIAYQAISSGSAAKPCAQITKAQAILATRLLVQERIKSRATAKFLSDGEGAWIEGCYARVVGKFDAVPGAIDWSTYYADVTYLPEQDRWEILNVTINEQP